MKPLAAVIALLALARFKRTLAIEDVELSGRGLFVVYRTEPPPAAPARRSRTRPPRRPASS